MGVGDNPPAFCTGSDASGDSSCNSSTGNSSDPNTPAAVSGAEDSSSSGTQHISSSNDSLDQIVANNSNNGAASGSDDTPPENKLNEVVAQLLSVSSNPTDPWEAAALHYHLTTHASPNSNPHHVVDNSQPLQQPPQQQQQQQQQPELSGIAGALSSLATSCGPLWSSFDDSRNIFNPATYCGGYDMATRELANQFRDYCGGGGGGGGPSVYSEDLTNNRNASAFDLQNEAASLNQMRNQVNKNVRPIVSGTPDTFYSPQGSSFPGLNQNGAGMPADETNPIDWNAFGSPDFGLPFGPPFMLPTSELDSQPPGFQIPGYQASGNHNMAYKGSGNHIMRYPSHGGNQATRFQPMESNQGGGYAQGADYQPAHGTPGPQYQGGMGGMPEGAVGGISDNYGNNGFSSSSTGRSGKPTYTECVDVQTSEHVAEIVGRQGCKIKELRTRTQTYIRTPTREEPPIFTVTGVKEKVKAAAREIQQMAEHFNGIRESRRPRQNNPDEVSVKVPIHTRLVGLVVGTKGITVKKIQEESGAYIVTPNKESPTPPYSYFLIKGQYHEVIKAEKMIKDHIRNKMNDDQAKQNNTNNPNKPDSNTCRSPRLAQGSKPPSPELRLPGHGDQQPLSQPANGFPSSPLEQSVAHGGAVNGQALHNGFTGPSDNGYSGHNNGFSPLSRNAQNGPSNSFTNGFADDPSGSAMLNRRNSQFSTNGYNGDFNSSPNSRFSNAFNSGMGNILGSTGFSGNQGSNNGFVSNSNRMNGRMSSMANGVDRWNGLSNGMSNGQDHRNAVNNGLSSSGYSDRRNGVGDRNTGFIMANGINGGLMNGWSSGINERNNFSQGSPGSFPNGLQNGLNTGFPIRNNSGLGQGVNGGASSDLNVARSSGVGYTSAPFAASSLTNGQINFSMAPGSGRHDSDVLGEDRSVYRNTFPSGREVGRGSTQSMEDYMMSLMKISARDFAPDVRATSSGIGAFDNSSLDSPLAPLNSAMNGFGPTGLATTTSFNAESSVALSSAFSGSMLASNGLMTTDPWAASSTGPAFPEASAPKPEVDSVITDFISALKIQDRDLCKPNVAEDVLPEEARENKEAEKEGKPEKEEKKEEVVGEGKAQDQEDHKDQSS